MEHGKRTEQLQTIDRGTYPTADELLSRAAALEAEVEIPELKCSVRVRQLTADDCEKLKSGSQFNGRMDIAVFEALTVKIGTVRPVFQTEHIDKIKRANPIVMKKISKAIWDLSGIQTDPNKTGEAKNA